MKDQSPTQEIKKLIRARIKGLKTRKYRFRNMSAVDHYAAEELQALLYDINALNNGKDKV